MSIPQEFSEGIPPPDRRAIERHLRAVRKNPENIPDMTVFILIEQCNDWYAAYLSVQREMDRKHG